MLCACVLMRISTVSLLLAIFNWFAFQESWRIDLKPGLLNVKSVAVSSRHEEFPRRVTVNVCKQVRPGCELSWSWGCIFGWDIYVPIWPLLRHSHSVQECHAPLVASQDRSQHHSRATWQEQQYGCQQCRQQKAGHHFIVANCVVFTRSH